MSSASKNAPKPKVDGTSNDLLLSTSAQQSDIRLLDSGEYSDFTVECGIRKWRTHKSILSRCPYFEAALNGNWEEDAESKIVIQGFEPLEINWFIRVLYSSTIDPDNCKQDLPSKSDLEACVRLWILGDYFGHDSLTKSALNQIETRCHRLTSMSVHISAALRGLPFISDLQAAIQIAWDKSKPAGDYRKPLLTLCFTIHPYLHQYGSFKHLLEEHPQFAVELLQKSLGFDISPQEKECATYICYECDARIEIHPQDSPEKHTGVIFHSIETSCLFSEGSRIFCKYCAHTSLPELNIENPGYHLEDCEECVRQKRLNEPQKGHI